MKTHSSSPRAAFRMLAALLVIVALLFAAGAQAQSTNWLGGVNELSTVYGTPADNDVVDNATLIITNGGNLTANQLNVGPTNRSMLTLDTGGTLTVQQLLATNVIIGGATNSLLAFNAGTLITSNAATAVASTVLIASNTAWTMNSSWIMNGGTNIFSYVATNTVAAANMYVGNATNNVQVNVNPGAVWWNARPANSSASNILGLIIGNGPATNTVFTVNGGSLIVTNAGGSGGIYVGNTANSSIGNQLIITNGGQVFTRAGNTGNSSGNIGSNGGSTNGLLVAGTNAAGLKSTWTFLGAERLSLGSSVATNGNNNWVQVDSGGVITNCDLNTYGVNNNLYITNGGQMFAVSGTFGRFGFNSLMVVGGFDAAGNGSLFRANNLTCAGGTGTPTSQQPGTNVTIRVDQGGVITNVNPVYVGKDTNSYGNTIIVTNGGQLFSSSAAYVGFVPGSSNGMIVGGAFGPTNSTWNHGGGSVTIGNAAAATNSYVTLNPGGVLTNVSSIILGGVNSLLTFNGGTLAAGTNGNLIATNATTVNATNLVQAGGATIDTVGYTVTNQLPVLATIS